MPSSYQSLEAQLHDPFWASEDTPELEWMDSLLSEHPGRALEIGSGSGRLLLPLLQKGHRIEGLEPSADMLTLCRQAAADLQLEPILYQGDMSSFCSPDSYDSLFLPAFTLQLADDPAAALSNFHQLLKPGGLLYLTVFIPYAELHNELPENEWYPDHETTLPDGRIATVHTRHQLLRKKRILHREHHYRLFTTDGSQAAEHLSEQSVRWFSAHQLRKMLDNARFTPERAVADFDLQPPITDQSQILTIDAHKQTSQSLIPKK